MSALPSPEVIRVARLEDALPDWPPSSLGWAVNESVARWHDSGHRPMRPEHLDGWTPAGLEVLRRVLRNALRANGRDV